MRCRQLAKFRKPRPERLMSLMRALAASVRPLKVPVRTEVPISAARAWRAGRCGAGGRGRRPSVPTEVVEATVADTLGVEPPDGTVCWLTRQMAARHGLGKDFIARVWRERGLRPWLADVSEMSTAPDFEAKLTDVLAFFKWIGPHTPASSTSSPSPSANGSPPPPPTMTPALHPHQ